MKNCEKPANLVTFVIFCYNQESYIKDAVLGALSQNYSPLEIVISDDSSSDNTVSEIKKCLADYSGPHKIRVNINACNMGLIAHINHVMKNFVASDFVVVAAGDDISLPHRVERLHEVWNVGKPTVKSIHSSSFIINADGSLTTEKKSYIRNQAKINLLENHVHENIAVLGAAHAWDMDIFRVFGSINEKTVNEDIVIPFRACLIGSVAFCPEALVKYRRGVGFWGPLSTANKNTRRRPIRFYKVNYYLWLQKYHDFKLYNFSDTYARAFKRRRAESIFKIHYLKNKKTTIKKLLFFIKRIGVVSLVYNVLVLKNPKLMWVIERFGQFFSGKIGMKKIFYFLTKIISKK